LPALPIALTRFTSSQPCSLPPTCACSTLTLTLRDLTVPQRRAHMGLLVNTMRTETKRTTAVREQIEALRHMTTGQLKDRYRDVFGEASRSNHKQSLFRRIAWR